MGKTFMVSSHILPSWPTSATRSASKKRASYLRRRRANRHPPGPQKTIYFVAVNNNQNGLAKEMLEGSPDVHSVEEKQEEDCLRVTLADGVRDGSFLADLLLRGNFRLRMLKEEEIDLEDVFMGITKGITN